MGPFEHSFASKSGKGCVERYDRMGVVMKWVVFGSLSSHAIDGDASEEEWKDSEGRPKVGFQHHFRVQQPEVRGYEAFAAVGIRTCISTFGRRLTCISYPYAHQSNQP